MADVTSSIPSGSTGAIALVVAVGSIVITPFFRALDKRAVQLELAHQAERQTLQNLIESIQADNRALHAAVGELNGRISEQGKRIASLEAMNNKLLAENIALKKLVHRQREQLTLATVDIARLKAEVNAELEAQAKQTRYHLN